MSTRDLKIVSKLFSEFEHSTCSLPSHPLWKQLKTCGTAIWLDTGDMNAIDKLWTNDMSAVTTNNTLLNNEIQKGIYDTTVVQIAEMLPHDVTEEDRCIEIAFYLNALHGLRLARRYNCRVSVELHTNMAHDIEKIEEYGHRFHQIDPQNFIIKIPFTPSGLIGARRLHNQGIAINQTLQFSARQNIWSAIIAKPAYSNVFMGRIQAYIEQNKILAPSTLSETVIKSTQHQLWELRKRHITDTRLIAASIRNANQLLSICGTDIYTIPPAIAEKGLATLEPPSQPTISPENNLSTEKNSSMPEFLRKLWKVDTNYLDAAITLSQKMPKTAHELELMTMESCCDDLFPDFTSNQWKTISDDGKIPVHQTWQSEIESGQWGVDAMLTAAGLASFASDQKALDNRINKILSK